MFLTIIEFLAYAYLTFLGIGALYWLIDKWEWFIIKSKL